MLGFSCDSLRRIIALAALSVGFSMWGTRLAAQTRREPIRLAVDARQAPQKILHAHLEIPVHAGPLTLYYPQWIPGEHMPDGPIIDVAGLKVTAGGKTIAWRRDLVDMFSFHMAVPQGATTLGVDLDFLLNAPATGFSGGASASANLDVLNWNQVLLYPAGPEAREITFIPSLRLPAGWKYGTALTGAKQKDDVVEFDAVPLTTLVDSPVITGKYFRAIQLTPGQTPMHEVDIVADSAAALAMPPEEEMHFRRLVAETGALFGARHYRNYHFLLTLSDDVSHFGLEHHESSDDRTAERSLIDEAQRTDFATLFPHEFTHSWNGKYRRPAGLATPNYQVPMKDDLLWVYEGLTQYLGDLVFPARAGLWTEEQVHEALAYLAAQYTHRPGRDWRPLQDTADAAPFLYSAGGEWANWRRGVDFYDEGELLWLDIDATIRGLTNDKKSLNDFCRNFYGGPGGEPALKTYTFEDVIAALNNVASYDWAGFLRQRLDGTSTNTPVAAVENSGWKLVYNDQPNIMQANSEEVDRRLDLSFSIGFILDDEGVVRDVVHDGPAYKAGIGPGMKIIAVNRLQVSGDGLREGIDAAKGTTEPIQLLVSNGSQFETISVDYHGGLRYPHIERNAQSADYLSEILRPLAK